MAKTGKKLKTKTKVIYHNFFCDDTLGEADGFFEVKGDKLEYVTGWFSNDAQWRGEYMTDLLKHAGADVQALPDEHLEEATKLMAKAYGLI